MTDQLLVPCAQFLHDIFQCHQSDQRIKTYDHPHGSSMRRGNDWKIRGKKYHGPDKAANNETSTSLIESDSRAFD